MNFRNYDGIIIMPGVYDGFSCRLVERSGFEWALISGAGLSESHLGWADMGLMSGTENVEWSRRLARCCNLKLIADADTGYGNALNVHFLVRDFEDAGVAGIMIEDQVWPKRCGHLAGKEVIPAGEMVEKVHAAVDARKNPEFVIKARTDARGPLGLQEAIRRGNLYAEAGADLIFADALLAAEEIQTFVQEVSAPVAINMGFGIQRRSTTPLVSARALEEMGVAVVEYPRLLTSAAIRGMTNAMSAFHDSLQSREPVERPDLLIPFEDLNRLVGLDTLRDMEQRYLTEEALARKYGSKGQ